MLFFSSPCVDSNTQPNFCPVDEQLSEQGNFILSRLQNLNEFVTGEIASLARSVRRLQGENEHLRDQILASNEGRWQSTAGEEATMAERQPIPGVSKSVRLDVDCPPKMSKRVPQMECKSADKNTGEDEPWLKLIPDSVCAQLIANSECEISSDQQQSQVKAKLKQSLSKQFDEITSETSSVSIARASSEESKESLLRKLATRNEGKQYRETDKRMSSGRTKEFTVVESWLGWEPETTSIVSRDSVLGCDENFMIVVKHISEMQQRKPESSCWQMIQPFIMSPISKKSMAFDIASVLLIAYDCVAVPLLLLEATESDDVGMYAMSWVTCLFWTLSIPRNFLTGFMKFDGTIEMSASAVFVDYRNTWFSLDLLIVAADWVDASFSRLMRVLRLLRAARLVRMMRIPNMVLIRFNYASSERMQLWIRITIATISFVILNHFLACAWYFVGSLYDNGWVTDLGVDSQSLMQKYVIAVHWSTSQFIGSTEVFPRNELERAFGAFIMCGAFIWSASFISRITAAMTRLQMLASHKSSLFSSLRQFLAHSNISEQLRLRVLSAAKHNLAQRDENQSEENVELLQYLSEPMLIEIHYEVHSGVLIRHPFFFRYNQIEPLAIQKLCHSAIDILTLGVADNVFTAGAEPTNPRMFFPIQGTLVYMKDVDGDGKIELSEMVQVAKPMWVSEPVLWMKWTHMGNLRAAQHCSVLALSAEEFCIIISEFRNTNYPAEYAAAMVATMNLAFQREYVDDLCASIDTKALVAQVFPHPLLRGWGSREFNKTWSSFSSKSSRYNTNKQPDLSKSSTTSKPSLGDVVNPQAVGVTASGKKIEKI